MKFNLKQLRRERELRDQSKRDRKGKIKAIEVKK